VSLTNRQKMAALAHLGVASTLRGDDLIVEGDTPTDAALAAAYDEAIKPTPSLQDQIDDLRGRIDKAAAVPVTAGTDAAKVRDALKPTQ
jgi:hypothetical protein